MSQPKHKNRRITNHDLVKLTMRRDDIPRNLTADMLRDWLSKDLGYSITADSARSVAKMLEIPLKPTRAVSPVVQSRAARSQMVAFQVELQRRVLESMYTALVNELGLSIPGVGMSDITADKFWVAVLNPSVSNETCHRLWREEYALSYPEWASRLEAYMPPEQTELFPEKSEADAPAERRLYNPLDYVPSDSD
jgi:hypothetical protein